MGCQQKVEYTYITGGGRGANGKKDPEFEKKILNINSDLEIFYSYFEPVNI